MATNTTRAARLALKQANDAALAVKVTASANVFRSTDDEASILTDPKDIAGEYREMVDGIETLDDAQIFAIINTVPGDDNDDAVVEARLDALKKAKPVSKEQAMAGSEPIPVVRDRVGGEIAPLSAVPSFRSEAVKYGAMLDDSDFGQHMETAAKAKEDYEGSALLITGDLERIFGEQRDENGNVTRENIIVNWPKPGTGSKKWREANPGFNGATDKYKVEDRVNGGFIEGYFSADIWDSSSKGKAIAAKITALKLMKEDKGALSPSIPKEFHHLEGDMKRIEATLKRWNSRRTNPLSRFRKAIAFIQAKAKLKEYPRIGMAYVEGDQMDKNAELNAPILLYRTEPEHKAVVSDSLSLTSFSNLKFDELGKLPEADQTMPRLMSISRRVKGAGKKPGATGQSKEGLDIRVRNVREFGTAMSEVTNYLEDTGAMGTLMGTLNKEGDDKWMLLENINDVHQQLGTLVKQYAPQWEVHLQEKRDAANAEAKAKLAALNNGKTAKAV